MSNTRSASMTLRPRSAEPAPTTGRASMRSSGMEGVADCVIVVTSRARDSRRSLGARPSGHERIHGVAPDGVALRMALLLRLPAAAERAVELEERDQLIQLGAGERVLGGEELLLRLEHFVVGGEPAGIAQVGEAHSVLQRSHL